MKKTIFIIFYFYFKTNYSTDFMKNESLISINNFKKYFNWILWNN